MGAQIAVGNKSEQTQALAMKLMEQHPKLVECYLLVELMK